jgi:hypothetical protein
MTVTVPFGNVVMPDVGAAAIEVQRRSDQVRTDRDGVDDGVRGYVDHRHVAGRVDDVDAGAVGADRHAPGLPTAMVAMMGLTGVTVAPRSSRRRACAWGERSASFSP